MTTILLEQQAVPEQTGKIVPARRADLARVLIVKMARVWDKVKEGTTITTLPDKEVALERIGKTVLARKMDPVPVLTEVIKV